MSKILFFLLSIIMSSTLFAQRENYETAIANFEAHYNSKNYEAIFNSFSPEMQKELPLEDTKQFLNGMATEAGKITSKTYIGAGEATYSIYKVTFDNIVLAVNISLDEQNKINGLFLEPFKTSTKTESKTINALSNYPQAIADIIFKNAAAFPEHTQISIAVIQNGQTNYYGIMKENDSIKSIKNEEKVFEIGSLTKVFTATVLATLVEDKKIKLTDDINAFYPFAFKDKITLKFENLANHTAGLPRLPQNLELTNITNPYKDYGVAEMNNYLEKIITLDAAPATTYAYSNLGAGLLGHTLGLSQKTSFEALLQKRIFDKYKMNSSSFSADKAGDRLVKGRDADGAPTSNWDFDVLFGGGGILSTTADLAKFAQA